MESAPARPVDRPWLNFALLVLTVGTAAFTFDVSFGEAMASLDARVADAFAFSATLVAILGAHEMGHYVLARLHGVDTSLPYFIPVPFLGPGTMGAVIRIRDRIPTRNALVDIGAAGPLAGLVVAIPLIAWGLAHAQLVDAPPVQAPFPGELSLWRLGEALVHWLDVQVLGAPAAPAQEAARYSSMLFADSPLMKGLQWLVLGPLPEGKEVALNPMVMAGWFGLLVTLLNLIPVGQLDGGHLTFALWGPRARWVGKAMALGLVYLIVFYTVSWTVWLVVVSLAVGFGHPEVTRPEEPLGTGRKLVCALCFVALAACAMPVPIRMVTW
jgi:membrane-associated protease RseP (regulator of RpoE activity)